MVEAAQIEVLQDTKRLQTRDRTSRGWRAKDLISSVGDVNRFQHLRLVLSEVPRAENAAILSHLLVYGGCDFAPVQCILAFLADPFQMLAASPYLTRLGIALTIIRQAVGSTSNPSLA